jgi:hypothetical protein
MLGSSSWMHYAPQGVKGTDDDDMVNMGHVVAQLIEALRYKSEGRGFDS